MMMKNQKDAYFQYMDTVLFQKYRFLYKQTLHIYSGSGEYKNGVTKKWQFKLTSSDRRNDLDSCRQKKVIGIRKPSLEIIIYSLFSTKIKLFSVFICPKF